jgi:hypothetical protein
MIVLFVQKSRANGNGLDRGDEKKSPKPLTDR